MCGAAGAAVGAVARPRGCGGVVLALVTAGGAQLDAGSVGLALARRWCEAGERALLVEAGAAGPRLSQRLGEADRADYSPSARGLPSLIVAREPVTLRLLADHCYSLDTSKGSLWALFAPSHPEGARRAAAWLAGRASDLAAVAVERRVVVASSLSPDGGPLAPLLKAVPIVVVLAPIESLDGAKALWTECRDAGLLGFRRGYRILVVEGDSPLSDADIRAETSMPVAGRLPVMADDRVLRLQGGRRDRAFIKSLDKLSGRLLAALSLDADAAETGPGPAAQAPARPEPARHPQPVLPGSAPAGEPHDWQLPPGSVPSGSVPPGSVPSGSVPSGSVPAGEPPDWRLPPDPMPPSSVPAGEQSAWSEPAGEQSAWSVPAGERSAWSEPRPEAGPPEQSPVKGAPAPARRAAEQAREAPGRRRTSRGRRS